MADQSERVILEVEEGGAVRATERANAGLDKFEKTAQRANENVQKGFEATVHVVDRSRNSIERLLSSLEKRANSQA